MLTVDGDPVTKARPRSGRGRTYTPKRTLDAEARIRELWMVKHGDQIAYDAGVAVQVDLYFAAATRRRADIDNLAKLVLDALNGLAYKDDSQILKLTVEVKRGVGLKLAGTDVSVVEYQAA